MDERYRNMSISRIFRNSTKLRLWQKTELAVINARVFLGRLANKIFLRIRKIWTRTKINISWWKKRDEEIHHDLNAFIDERNRYLDEADQAHTHDGMTSYDTQEPAFAEQLRRALAVVNTLYGQLENSVIVLAQKYRYTLMLDRTHGQWALLSTFGARCLTWLTELRIAERALRISSQNLEYSKLSGATGKYGRIDPELEEEALKILNFKPLYGVTQIMPRILYAPVAQGLYGIVQVLSKIALDIRLAARSGCPLMHEPFKKKQKGSSAMPHKKNTIRTEQMEGMARMALGYLNMIMENIRTWEERAIEQSCVERVAWPDLFHVTCHSLKVMVRVLSGLKVYPENMLREIHESRGTYASNEVKEFLKQHFARLGLAYNDAYRTVQMACFNVFEPSENMMTIRDSVSSSFEESTMMLYVYQNLPPENILSIQDFIPRAELRWTDDLDITPDAVGKYNSALGKIFSKTSTEKQWNNLFNPVYLLRHHETLYREILGK